MSAHEDEAPPPGEEIHLPGPSLVPFLNAVGISLAIVGITTFWIVSVAGILLFVAIVSEIAAGQDPDAERVATHMTDDPLFATPEWSLEQAAVAMIRGRFRHVIVIEGAEVAGVLSMRDVVRCWTDDGASCEVPAPPQIAA